MNMKAKEDLIVGFIWMLLIGGLGAAFALVYHIGKSNGGEAALEVITAQCVRHEEFTFRTFRYDCTLDAGALKAMEDAEPLSL